MTPERTKEERRIPRAASIAATAVAFLLFVLLVSTVFGKKGLLEIAKARRTYAELETEIRGLQEKKARLEKEIAALDADPKAVEREAREKLWLMKPDEKVLIKKKG
ncbi:MAG: septum formation initiator family protein [Candidatus Aminicenantes bacterium]|nr:septum formation initiator family protein [Candidatus Aminicenantes bacterium]